MGILAALTSLTPYEEVGNGRIQAFLMVKCGDIKCTEHSMENQLHPNWFLKLILGTIAIRCIYNYSEDTENIIEQTEKSKNSILVCEIYVIKKLPFFS